MRGKQRLNHFITWATALFLLSITIMPPPPCFADNDLNQPDKHLESVTLQLKWKHQFQFAGYYAALEKGFYRKAGLDVKILEAESGTESTDVVLEGKADFGIAMSDIILHRVEGKPVVALACIFQHSPLVFLTPKSSGIGNVHALKGKRIGLEAHAAELLAYLDNEGVSLKEVELFPHEYDISNLISGKVDAISAYSTDEPFVLLDQGIKYNTFTPRAGGIDFYGDTLFTSEKMILENPGCVNAFVKASLKGWEYALNNSEEIVDLILSKYTRRHSREHLMFEAKMSKKLIMATVVNIGYMYIGRWNHIAKTYQKLGMIKNNFSLDGFLYDSDPETDYSRLKRALGVTVATCLLLGLGALVLFLFNRRLTGEINERKNVEGALQKSEEQKRAILDGITANLALVNENLEILWVNKTSAQSAGKMPEEMIGHKCHEFWADPEKPCDDCPSLRAWKTGKSEQTIIRTPDGRVWDERGEPVFGQNGKIIGVIEIAHDITDRVRTEGALRDNERRFQTLYSNIPGMIYRGKPDWSTDIIFNSEILTGYLTDDFYSGKINWIDLIHPDDKQKVIEEGSILNQEQLSIVQEYRVYNKDGKTVWVSDHKTSTFNAEGSFESIDGIVYDITDRKNIETALFESEKKFRFMAETGAEYIWQLDLTGQVTYASPAVKNISGYTPAEVKNFRFDVFFPESEMDRATTAFTDAVAGKENQLLEFMGIKKDGSPIPIEVSITPMVRNGEIVGVQGVARDITERKIAEQHLSQERERNEQYLQLAGVMFIGLDENENVIIANNKACEVLEYTNAEIVGQNWFDRFIPQNQRAEVRAVYKKLIAGDVEPVEYYENHVLSKKGKKKLIAWHNAFIRNEHRKIIGILGSGEDITEIRKAENELQRQKELFQTIIDSIPALITVYDPHINTLLVNKSFETTIGWSTEALKHINIMDACYPDPDCKAKALEYMNQATSDWKEFSVMTRFGHTIDSIWSNVKLEDGTLIGIGVDISEKKLLETNLRHAQKMESIGKLAGGIAHEFNNILGIILGNIELAISDAPKQSPVKDSLEEIRSASLRAKDVVNKILSFARKMPEERTPIQIGTIVKDSLKLLRATIPANIDIQQNNDCSSELILSNQTEIHQVLMNLCTNSAHALGEKSGAIEISLKPVRLDNSAIEKFAGMKPGNYVQLIVKDNGKGIPPEIMERIFDPYFSTKSVKDGLGMGLAIVYGIIKEIDGTVNIESAQGAGTTVELLFPVIEGHGESNDSTGGHISVGSERILVVDDEASLVKMLKRSLTRLGYEVAGSTSSLEGLKLFTAEPEKFDLVITDIAMPQMAGDELAVELLKIRSDIPIILCTGHSERIDEKKARALGIRNYILKPYNIKGLGETIRGVLEDTKSKM